MATLRDSGDSPSHALRVHSSYVGEMPLLKNVTDVTAWHQRMRCWKSKGEANIFKDATKKVYKCVENGMANLILLCTFGPVCRYSCR